MADSYLLHRNTIDALQTVTKMYADARAEPFADHPLADYLRHEAPNEIEKAIKANNLICKGSAGQSQWADVPWIGIFDPEEQLQIDLDSAVSLYLRLTSRGGVGTFEDDAAPDSETEDISGINEKRRYRYHRKIERNRKASNAAKKAHGYKCQASHYSRHCQSEKLTNIYDTVFFNTIDPLRLLQHECFNVCFW